MLLPLSVADGRLPQVTRTKQMDGGGRLPSNYQGGDYRVSPTAGERVVISGWPCKPFRLRRLLQTGLGARLLVSSELDTKD